MKHIKKFFESISISEIKDLLFDTTEKLSELGFNVEFGHSEKLNFALIVISRNNESKIFHLVKKGFTDSYQDLYKTLNSRLEYLTDYQDIEVESINYRFTRNINGVNREYTQFSKKLVPTFNSDYNLVTVTIQFNTL